jgi:hypothetical protein
MFFRFAAALLLVVLVSMAGIRLEKQTLELRRAVSLQHYQCDLLVEMTVQLRLEAQQLAARQRSKDSDQSTSRAGVASWPPQSHSAQPSRTRETPPAGTRDTRLPLLEFPGPFDPEGID